MLEWYTLLRRYIVANVAKSAASDWSAVANAHAVLASPFSILMFSLSCLPLPSSQRAPLPTGAPSQTPTQCWQVLFEFKCDPFCRPSQRVALPTGAPSHTPTQCWQVLLKVKCVPSCLPAPASQRAPRPTGAPSQTPTQYWQYWQVFSISFANVPYGGNKNAHALVATKRLREGPEGPTARPAFGAQRTPKQSAWSTQ